MLALSVGVPGVAAGAHRVRPDELFADGQGGFWFDFTDTATLFQDTAGTTPATAGGDPIALVQDISGNGLDGKQLTAGIEPLVLAAGGAHFEKGTGGQNIEVTIPTGGLVGTMVIGTTVGCGAYHVSIPEGTYNLSPGPGDYGPWEEWSDDGVTGYLFREGRMSGAEITAAIEYMAARGATRKSYAGEDDMDSYWYGRLEITHFLPVDTSACTDPEETWRGCENLVEFPQLDLRAATSLDRAWRDCRSLPRIPWTPTPNNTKLSATFKDCRVLEAVPAFDTAIVTTLREMCRNCYALTDMPWIDTAQVTDFHYAWRRCQSLAVFPELDFTQGQDFSGCWEDTAIVDFPPATFPNATTFNSAWYDNPNLITFPAGAFDTCQATDFTLAFADCALDEASVDAILVSIEAAGTSNGTLDITGGTSAAPSSAVFAAIDALRVRGWTVNTNGS